jgi:hypothetical protein
VPWKPGSQELTEQAARLAAFIVRGEPESEIMQAAETARAIYDQLAGKMYQNIAKIRSDG